MDGALEELELHLASLRIVPRLDDEVTRDSGLFRTVRSALVLSPSHCRFPDLHRCIGSPHTGGKGRGGERLCT